MGFGDSTRSYFKDNFSNSYRSISIRFKSTKAYQNYDSLNKYKQIYETLMVNQIPIVTRATQKKEHSRTENYKTLAIFGSFAFFFGFTKFGPINKVFFAMVTSQIAVFFLKCNFYRKMVDELSF